MTKQFCDRCGAEMIQGRVVFVSGLRNAGADLFDRVLREHVFDMPSTIRKEICSGCSDAVIQFASTPLCFSAAAGR